MLQGEEAAVFADAGYQASTARSDATGAAWHVAMRPGKRWALVQQTKWGALLDKAEQLKAGVRAKLERTFQIIKCQFGFARVRCKGLVKNTAQLITLFALRNLWMTPRQLKGVQR